MEMTKKELTQRLAAMGPLPDEETDKIVCALIGHSRIVTYCFGYQYCARCSAQVGDTLGSVGIGVCVIVGHKCEECETNMKKMTWRDTYRTPDPFAKAA